MSVSNRKIMFEHTSFFFCAFVFLLLNDRNNYSGCGNAFSPTITSVAFVQPNRGGGEGGKLKKGRTAMGLHYKFRHNCGSNSNVRTGRGECGGEKSWLTVLSASSRTRTAATSSSSSDAASRLKRTAALLDWAKSSGIKFNGIEITQSNQSGGGLGIFTTRDAQPNEVVLEVPTPLVISVHQTQSGGSVADDNPTLNVKSLLGSGSGKKIYRDIPWWARLSIQLNVLDKLPTLAKMRGGDNTNMKPWINSLPQKFDTPIHWSKGTLEEQLQYSHLVNAVRDQKRRWGAIYDQIVKQSSGNGGIASVMSYEDFEWGCEVARSRAFSGTYAGSAFNPIPYVLTLLLVTLYVGLNLGTLEQAANGAALVLCATILKDFVLPKLFKKKRYVICPCIDMANHVGTGERGVVAFEYFADGYSLSVKKDDDGGVVKGGSELFVSYGSRSNDQLLQYYGFVEQDNAHDVYVMPPIREWNVEALEEACGRKFSSGRLQKLDRAGLLGQSVKMDMDDDDGVSGEEMAANKAGGVVVTRAGGIDPAVMQAFRALVSTDEEWEAAGEAVGNFAAEFSGGEENEKMARLVARTALELELAAKPTTLEEDIRLFQTMGAGSKGMGLSGNDEKLAVSFRIEKKKLLREIIEQLR